MICLFYGARKGGIALGLLGGSVWSFWSSSSTFSQVNHRLIHAGYHCGGGGIGDLASFGRFDVMLQIAEKLLRRNPKYVSLSRRL